MASQSLTESTQGGLIVNFFSRSEIFKGGLAVRDDSHTSERPGMVLRIAGGSVFKSIVGHLACMQYRYKGVRVCVEKYYPPPPPLFTTDPWAIHSPA